MNLRFIVADIHAESGKESGVFDAVGNLRKAGRLHQYEEEQHDVILQSHEEESQRDTAA